VAFYPVSANTAFGGSLTVAGNITAQGLGIIQAGGGFNAGVGSVDIPQAGAGLKVAEGANAKQGTFTLAGGTTQAVPNTSVTANSRIFLTAQVDGGTPGLIGVASRIPGTSFTVACVATDTSTYAYEIFEPG
jgi:hypothetical protein